MRIPPRKSIDRGQGSRTTTPRKSFDRGQGSNRSTTPRKKSINIERGGNDSVNQKTPPMNNNSSNLKSEQLIKEKNKPAKA